MKRKGFTLIELLAVIIILSVISLITTPMIFGIIDTARKNSFKVTCTEIYNSYDVYVAYDDSIGKNNLNIIFDFSSNRQNTEIIGNIKYEPVSKLNLKGELPKYGTYQIQNEKRTLKVDNGKYTCIIDGSRSEILDGTVEENDTTAPVINDVIITSTTNSIKVVVDAIEEDGVIVKYYYKFNGEEIVSENNSKTYTNLKANEEYEIEIVVENKSGLKSDRVVKKIVTKSVSNPTIKQMSQTPSSGTWATSRTIQITYSNTNVTSPVYYFKSSVGATVASGVVTASCGTGTNPGTCTTSSVTTLVANTWYKTTSKTPSVIYKANGTLYALTSDGANISGTSTFTISKIDTSAPSASMSIGSIKTDRATITATCNDAQSGITKYEYSKDNGTTWISNGTTSSYTFTGLTKETSYKYKIRCTNGSGLTKEASSTSSTLGFTNPTIKQTAQVPTSGYSYATSRTIQITYSSTNVNSPVYYFKSSVGATVASGVVTAACGTGTNPGTCTTSSVTTLVANTWYKTTSKTPSVIYKANGTLYALTSDGANISGTSTFTISKIDTSAPSASMSIGSIKTDRATITATCNDAQSGITKYEYSKDNGTTWISNGTTSSYTFTGLTKETSYKYKIRCTNGSGLTKEASSTSSTLGFTNPTIKQTAQVPTSGYSYATSRTIQITYSSTNVNSPVYYFKSSVGATVASGVVTAACGTGTNPGTCTSSSVTTLVANTWYKTTSTTPSVIYKANGVLYALTSDGANISGTSTFTISKIDTSIPTTPTVTYNGGSNSHSWKNNYNITLTSTATSGIHHYEVDWDGDGVANYASSSNFIPWDGYSSCNNRFRAVSNSGVVSGWTDVQHIHMDTSAPGVTTITYNGGANTCTWKNNYNITLTASDNIGVSYYQIDTNNDGIADAQTASNFIPANGYHSHTVRFRAVDYAGNIGTWTENQHIHMDTEKPSCISSGGSDAWTNDSRTLVGTCSDSVSGCQGNASWYINWQGSWINLSPGTVYDNAGNSTVCPSNQTVKIDKTAPTISPNLASGTYSGERTVTFTATDSNSGIQAIQYKIYLNGTLNSANQYLKSTSFSKTLTGGTWDIYVKVLDNANNWYSTSWTHYTYVINTSYAATSYAATPNTTTYPTQPTGETYRCCWHISSANASKSQCASDTIVDYEDGSGRWECDQCSTCPRKACTNGGTQNGDICTKTEYTCPNGGTLSGTTCVLYTCPNGGTLSGTTCVK